MSKKLTYEYVKNYIESFGYKLLSTQYINAREKIEIKCDKNHSSYMVRFYNFKSGYRCPECGKESKIEKQKFKYSYVKQYIESHGYTLLSKIYTNTFTKLNIICDKCHIFEMNFADFKEGTRCPECAIIRRTEKRKLDYNYVKNQIEKEGFVLLSKQYKNCDTKLKILCPEGHIFEKSYDKFRIGQRCPICAESKGECNVRLVLENNKQNFISQYSFADCINIEPLRFDFAVFDINNKLLFLIEYDGEYHYLPIEGKAKLKYQQKLDNIKNVYCQNNNIPLVRIPYWEFDNIEKIVSEILQQYNLIAA